jgi:hypothetical protein
VLTLVAVTAALLAVTLVVGLIAAVVWLVKIRRFVADTSAALVVAAERAGLVAGRLARVQRATGAAAGDLRRTST